MDAQNGTLLGVRKNCTPYIHLTHTISIRRCVSICFFFLYERPRKWSFARLYWGAFWQAPFLGLGKASCQVPGPCFHLGKPSQQQCRLGTTAVVKTLLNLQIPGFSLQREPVSFPDFASSRHCKWQCKPVVVSVVYLLILFAFWLCACGIGWRLFTDSLVTMSGSPIQPISDWTGLNIFLLKIGGCKHL